MTKAPTLGFWLIIVIAEMAIMFLIVFCLSVNRITKLKKNYTSKIVIKLYGMVGHNPGSID